MITGRMAGAMAATSFLISPSNALVPPPAVAVSGVTPFNNPAGAADVAAAAEQYVVDRQTEVLRQQGAQR